MKKVYLYIHCNKIVTIFREKSVYCGRCEY